MIDDDDRGRALVDVVVARVAATYPATAVLTEDGGLFHGTIATFVPRNRDGATVTLYAAFD